MKKKKPPLARFRIRHPLLYSMIVATALIMVWRGVWGLLDEYIFPGYPFYSYTLSLLIGGAFLYYNDYSLKELEEH